MSNFKEGSILQFDLHSSKHLMHEENIRDTSLCFMRTSTSSHHFNTIHRGIHMKEHTDDIDNTNKFSLLSQHKYSMTMIIRANNNNVFLLCV